MSNSRTHNQPPWQYPNNCTPTGAYSLSSDNEMGKYEIGLTKQIFYSQPLATIPLQPTAAEFFNPNDYQIELVSSEFGLNGERPWIVSINALEVMRPSAEEVTNLSKDFILKNGKRYSILQALIKVADSSAGSKWIKVDVAGGTTIPVIGRNVQVYILSPSNTVEITRDNASRTTPVLSGMVCDTIISAKIAPLLNSNGNFDILKYTWNQGIAAATTEFVEIPPSARRVNIINANTAIATPIDPMYFWMSDDPSGHNMGIIDFVTNSTGLINIPCGATHINTNVDEATDRAFSFIFLIDP